MADSKITALTSIGTSTDPSLDQMVIVDTSDGSMAATGTTKKVSLNQLLSSNPSATGGLTLSGALAAGSATITGDLTVDTNTLKVDSANNRVGIGTASPAAGNLLHISGTAAVPLLMQRTGSNDVYLSFTDNSGLFGYFGFSNGDLRFQTPGSSYANKYVISSDGTSTWSNVGGVAGTAMTLNSTGLGVQATPSAPFTVKTRNSDSVGLRVLQSTGGTGGIQFTDDPVTSDWGAIQATSANVIFRSNTILKFQTGGVNDRLTIDSSGNVGVGVTPSAFGGGRKAIQISSPAQVVSANLTMEIGSNWWNDGTNYKYTNTNAVSLYSPSNGTHTWFIAPSGTAGNNITFTQAMTLDATRNLSVNTTAYTGVGTGVINSTGGLNIVPDNTGSALNRNWQLAANGSAAGNLDFTISSANNTYPNSAYRMQLTSAGALNNTTGTYGTISDLRLKENISDARNYLADLLKLRVVKYSLKEESSAVATKLGFIAQEVEQVFPNLVDQSDVAYDGGEGIRSVKTSILIPMLLKAIQELTARVEALEA